MTNSFSLPAIVSVLALSACGPSSGQSGQPAQELLDAAVEYCAAEDEIFRPDLYQITHFSFDWLDATSIELSGRDDVEEFRSEYALDFVHISNLIMMHESQNQAIGRGVKLPFGAPDELTNPFQPYLENNLNQQDENVFLFHIVPDASSCELSESVLGFVDDYLYFIDHNEHISLWLAGSSHSRNSYRFALWNYDQSALPELRQTISASIDAGRCLAADLYPSSAPMPLATKLTEHFVLSGSESFLNVHEISFDGEIYYRARNGLVQRRVARRGNQRFTCCTSTLRNDCTMMRAIPANVISLRQEVETRYD